MFEVRNALSMVAGSLGDQGNCLRRKMFPAMIKNQAGGFAMVPFTGRCHAPTGILEHGRGLQEQPVLVSQSVKIFQLIKELQREVGDMQDMMGLLFERLHEGEEFLASRLIIHGASKRAPKRSPRVLTYNCAIPKCCMTAS